MLPSLEQWQPGSICRLHIDRADVVALRFDPHHPQWPPLIAQRLGLQTGGGLLPGAGEQTGRRDTVETPAQGQSGGTTHNMFHVERPQALGTLKCLNLRTVKDDFSSSTEMQQIASVEIDKQQSGPGIDQQIA
ncbi:hypothetical protein D3C85_626210 [compost metagenome]